MIVAQDLHKSFKTPTGTVRAVEGVRFTARDGEITGLLGPNGAGKTTTLRSLAGILRPTSGRVRIDNHDLIDDPLEAKRMRDKLVQRLEERLRVRLLNRTTRRVTVTPEGAAYYERTSRVLNDIGLHQDVVDALLRHRR